MIFLQKKYKTTLFFILVGISHAALSAPAPVASYQFNNNLNAVETGVPALTAIDPLNQSQFITDTVFGESRPVYEFKGNIKSIENAGLSFPSLNLLNKDDAFSIEMIFQFTENQSTWENILGLSNRQNDRAFYVQPNNSLQVWPDDSGIDSFIFGEYHHVTLTNDGNGHITVYIDGAFQFDSSTETVNFSKYTDVNPERLIHFFADNIVGGGQDEFSNGKVALIRIYDSELNAEDALEIKNNPFTELAASCESPENNSCVATYNQDGTLHIPCVSVPDGLGGTIMYQANMSLVPLSSPLTFVLTESNPK